MRISFVLASLAWSTLALPTNLVRRQSRTDIQNAEDAIQLNEDFSRLSEDSSCETGDQACIDGGFAQCVDGSFVISPCGSGTSCSAFPLIGTKGTSIACLTPDDRDARFSAAGVDDAGGSSSSAGDEEQAADDQAAEEEAADEQAAEEQAAEEQAAEEEAAERQTGNNDDPDSSLTLDPAVLSSGFENDGQSQPADGQVASLTSSNNFINFCSTVDFPLTNGAQVTGGSCNPAPMGVIAAKSKMPSSKFVNPPNLATIPADEPFTIEMAIQNLETGNFVNAAENYFSAPQQVNRNGIVRGHSHVVIQEMESLESTEVLDPEVFVFFKGLNDKASGGVLTAEVTEGLPAGFYRLASINTAANHQPVLVAVAQHGSLDDIVYFTVE